MPIELDKKPTKERTYGTNAITGKQEPWRDGNGQYRFLNPDKGELRSYMRASSVADGIEDKFMLQQWKLRAAIRGVGLRKSLYMMAKGHDPDIDRGVYDHPKEGLVAKALNEAKTDEAAILGKSLHRDTERYDLGTTDVEAYDEDVRPHITNYAAKLAESGFAVVPEHIEQVIINDDYGIGGSNDRVLIATRDILAEMPCGDTIAIPTGTMIIGDLKTGKIPEYKFIEFGVQITIYANHTATWHVDHDHPQGGTRGERIDVSREVGLVIHLPATDPEGPCTLHWVDLRKGYEYFLLAMELRAMKSAPVKRQLIGEYVPVGADEVAVLVNGRTEVIPVEQTAVENYGYPEEAEVIEAPFGNDDLNIETLEWIMGRVAKIGECSAAAMGELQRRWPLRDPNGNFEPLPEVPTEDQIEAVLTVLDDVEARHEIPLPLPRPKAKQEPSELAKLLQLTN